MTRQAERQGPLREAAAVTLTIGFVLLPLFLFFLRHGYSSGDDLPFHLGSWQDAARQLRHGVYPQWDLTAARGAGEPRFLFYPPLSWLLGAALRLLLSPAHAAECFVGLSIAACFLCMYGAVRQTVPTGAALVAATLYAAAPYTLFNGMERAALGELLASAWLPLLFAAAAAPAPSAAAVAVPLALLWLTNVPTAIAGCYLLLLTGLLRLLQQGSGRVQTVSALSLGTVAGLMLPAFFLFPALHRAGSVQLASAFTAGQSFLDNFLLRHTSTTSRQTLHAVTVITLAYATCLLVMALGYLLLLRREWRTDRLALLLAAVAVLVAFLLVPPSTPLWQYLPKLAVLQFPWRLLGVLTLVVAYAAALLTAGLQLRTPPAVAACAVLAAILIPAGATAYWRDPHEQESTGLSRAETAVATELRPTQEYTPAGARNAGLQPLPAVLCGTQVTATWYTERQPLHATIDLPTGDACTLPLRDYPLWTMFRNGEPFVHTHRPDGRMVLALPPGRSVVEARWNSGLDRTLGWCGTALGLTGLLVLKQKRP